MTRLLPFDLTRRGDALRPPLRWSRSALVPRFSRSTPTAPRPRGARSGGVVACVELLGSSCPSRDDFPISDTSVSCYSSFQKCSAKRTAGLRAPGRRRGSERPAAVRGGHGGAVASKSRRAKSQRRQTSSARQQLQKASGAGAPALNSIKSDRKPCAASSPRCWPTATATASAI